MQDDALSYRIIKLWVVLAIIGANPPLCFCKNNTINKTFIACSCIVEVSTTMCRTMFIHQWFSLDHTVDYILSLNILLPCTGRIKKRMRRMRYNQRLDTKEDKRFFTQRLGKQNFNHLLFSKFRTYTRTIQIIISQPWNRKYSAPDLFCRH